MEEQILKFRNKAIPYFKKILIADNYPNEMAEDLAFYIVKILEDSFPLLRQFENESDDVESIMDNIHLLFTNYVAFENGRKVLMYEN